MKVKNAAGIFALLSATAVAGVLCAQALGQVGVPLPTVSLPSITVPSVPIPTTPTPPSIPPTPPAAAPPAPAVPRTPVTAPSPPSPPSQGPSPSTSLPSTGGYSSTFSATSPGARPRQPAADSSPQSRARVTRLKASPRRFRSGSKRKGTRITFRLTTAARVLFVVRGPAPSCRVVGRFSVRGREGSNRVRFTGRIGKRTLGPGTYTVTANPAGRAQKTRPVIVTIDPRNGTLARQRLNCSPSESGSLFGGGSGFSGDTGSSDANGSAAAATSSKAAGKKKASRGVLPAIAKKIQEIPEAIPRPPLPREGDTPPAILGLLILALLVLPGLGILAYVIRFARGADTTSA